MRHSVTARIHSLKAVVLRLFYLYPSKKFGLSPEHPDFISLGECPLPSLDL